MKNRDLYNDNIFDVTSVNDIMSETTMTLLEKQDKHLLFEFCNDFFKYDMEEKKMIQYPDFVSLTKNKNSKDCTFTDYGFAIADSISSNEELEFLKNYDLKSRESYIKKDLGNGYFTIPMDIINSVNKTKSNLKDLTGKSQELGSVNAMTNALVDTLALLFCYYKALKIKNSKSKVIDEVLQKYNQEKLYSITKDRNLLQEVPELKDVVQKCNDFLIKVEIDKNFSDFQEKYEKVSQLASFALGDKQILETCEKISESLNYQENIAQVKNKLQEISENIAIDLPDIQNSLMSSQEEKLNILKSVHDKNFTKFFTGDLGLSIDNKDDKVEFLIANNFFSRNLKGDTDEDYDKSVMRFISDPNELDNLNISNVKLLIEKIADNLLDIKQSKSLISIKK